MTRPNPFGAMSTADQVLAGVDLSGKRYVITGCNSGIGFETMNALAANGATVIGLARSLALARSACERAGPTCSPVACDLTDLHSVTVAAESLKAQHPSGFDGIIANAGIAALPRLELSHGVELQLLVNYVSHFALIDRLQEAVRDGSGRIVLVTSQAAIMHAPAAGVALDNLDGRGGYDPLAFYGQSKVAVALYARELARRMAARGITVNTAHPGATRGTGIHRHRAWSFIRTLALPCMRSVQRGAATQTLLAASPHAAGITGEYWTDCQIARGHPRLADDALAQRLWEWTARLIAAPTQRRATTLPEAA